MPLRVILDENNDLPPGGPVLAGGAPSARVAYQAVFGTQAGEWRYDFTFGTQWRNGILRKFFNPSTTRSLIAATANTVPDGQPITSSQVALDTTTNANFRQVDIELGPIVIDDEPVTISVSTLL